MIVSKKHKKLVLNLRDPERITTIIPSARALQYKGKTLVAIPHRIDETRVLRNLGIDAPAPMGYYYDWPGRYKPFAHQKTTSEFLTLNTRAFCLNGMGAGKTVSVLWSFDYLKKLGLVKRMLVISPLSTLERAWGDEIFRHFPELTFAVLHGDRAKRHQLLANDFDIYIINHDGIKNDQTVKLLNAREGLDLIVVDECFPAGTEVTTPSGPRAIETLAVGDVVSSSRGEKKVTHVFKKHVRVLVEVKLTNGTKIKCTPEHPFATDRGWLPAKDLEGRTLLDACDVLALRGHVHSESVPPKKPPAILQSGLLEAGDHSSGYSENRTNLESETRPNDSDKDVCGVQHRVSSAGSNGEISPAVDLLPQVFHDAQVDCEQGSNASREQKSFGGVARAAPVEQGGPNPEGGSRQGTSLTDCGAYQVLGSTGWKWYGNVLGGELCGSNPTLRVHLQLPNTDGPETGQRVSDLLQSGLWSRRAAGSCGGGRAESQHTGAPGAGQEEGGSLGGVRVESVSPIQLEGEIPVWNIEVAGPHDYFAGGVLVHNCASFRNSSTERWKALNALINGSKKLGTKMKTWAWGLTGTPIPNAPTDAWAQVKLINPTNAPGFFGQFRDTVMKPAGPFGWTMRESALDTVRASMQPAVRFSREECIDLPPTTFVTRQTTLTPEQKKAFDDMLKKLKAECEGGQVTAINEAVKMSKLLQICCGVAIGTEGDVVLPNGPRIELVREIIEEAEAKVLVFVPFTSALEAVAAELRKDFTVDIVNGDTSKHARDETFKNFQNSPNPRVIVANSGTLSHGLTLTAANTIIWMCPIHSNETYMQANARVTRPGQKLNTLIVNIEATELERKIYARLQGKEKTQGILLDLVKGVK